MLIDKGKKTVVLYHSDADGFGSAYAVWKRLGDGATYIPVQYGRPVPAIPEGTVVVAIVDFSYSRSICEDLAQKYELYIFDHHKTAEAELAGLTYARFSIEKSGCGMVWETQCPGEPIPDLLAYVQDRDLWKFDLPYSKEVNLYIATLPWDFAVWDSESCASNFVSNATYAGSAIKAFMDGQMKSALRSVRIMRVGHAEGYWDIPVLNVSENVSEIGNMLCVEYPTHPFSATYCDRKDVRSWSLRSVGEFDVSAVAKSFGGGGHKNAAGFTTDIGWPQVTPDEFILAFESLATPD